MNAPLSAFSYETDGQRHSLLKDRDVIIFYSEDRVAAAARVTRVEAEHLNKVVPCCPRCNVTRIQMRKRKLQLPYRCCYGHEFATPGEKIKETSVHTAILSPHWARITADIEVAELRAFEFTTSRVVKLRHADLGAVCAYIARRDRRAAPLLQVWLEEHLREIDENGRAGGANTLAGFPGDGGRDQASPAPCESSAFRDQLIARYGARCMISGSTVFSLLRACPVSRRQRDGQLHPTNGLILRADLCSLFALNLIGLEPEKLELAIHPALSGTEYQEIAGKRLTFPRHKGVDIRAIRRRWNEFKRKSVEASSV